MKALGEAIKLVFAKVGDFLDLFDLSFIVSGALGFCALWLWATFARVPLPPKQHGALLIIILLFSSYVNGMVFFAAGRFLRRLASGKKEKGGEKGSGFDEFFLEILKAHGLDGEPGFQDYLQRNDHRGTWRLYIRLWAEARQAERLSPSLILLKRYWVMAATYDGLAVALLLWLALFVRWLFGFEGMATPWLVLIPTIVLLLALSWACFVEADRYTKNQAEELVASIASERARTYKASQLVAQPPVPMGEIQQTSKATSDREDGNGAEEKS